MSSYSTRVAIHHVKPAELDDKEIPGTPAILEAAADPSRARRAQQDGGAALGLRNRSRVGVYAVDLLGWEGVDRDLEVERASSHEVLGFMLQVAALRDVLDKKVGAASDEQRFRPRDRRTSRTSRASSSAIRSSGRAFRKTS